MTYPVPGETLAGTLPRKNAALKEAEESLAAQETSFYLNEIGERSFWSVSKGVRAKEASYYKEHFRQGATIVPRALWFVEVMASPLGLDPSLPPLESADRAKKYAKGRWQGLVLKGNVESRFLYATLLSTDLLPFGHFNYRPVVLPIEPTGEDYSLVTAEEAQKRGIVNLANWLREAQREWEERRGEKAERMDVLEYLDYYGKLTSQSSQTRYRVLYPKSATHLCACVAESQAIRFDVGGQEVRANGFLTDHVTYYLETDQLAEAHYLVAMLNAPFVNQVIKPMQARGLWGPRDIHKKILELPIPEFDPSNDEHRKLAVLGKDCLQKVTDWLEAGGPGDVRSIGKLRSMVREMLTEELRDIDGLVEPLLRSE